MNNEFRSSKSTLSEPQTEYKAKPVSRFSSFEDMENDQLAYFASLQPTALLQNLKQMVLASFGFKTDSLWNSLPRTIHFNSDEV